MCGDCGQRLSHRIIFFVELRRTGSLQRQSILVGLMHSPEIELLVENETIFQSLNQPMPKCGIAASPLAESAEHGWFSELVETHGSSVMALLRRLCRHAQDADDVFQETAVRVWRFRANQRPVNARAWLMTVAYRAFLDHRGRQRHRSQEIQDGSGVETDGAVDHRVRPPGDLVEQNETVQRMNAAILKLPESLREIVVLHYSGGLSLSETAEAMNISLGTVKSRLNSALRQMRSALQ